MLEFGPAMAIKIEHYVAFLLHPTLGFSGIRKAQLPGCPLERRVRTRRLHTSRLVAAAPATATVAATISDAFAFEALSASVERNI